MSRILISFVGTGIPAGREYRPVTYKVGEEMVTTSFVAKALMQFVKPDRVFLIGTAHSMWEEVYKSFSEHYEASVWERLGDWCQSANHETSPDEMPYREDIEAAIGDGSKIFLIKYGLNEVEIADNTDTILGIRNCLEDDNEIVFDITHSFRSLPVMIMQLILYLQQLESPRVTVSHVYYGMLDVIREFQSEDCPNGYAPIVDLKEALNINKWISGGYQFKLTGSSSIIYNLLKETDKQTATRIKRFSDILGLNDLNLLQSQTRELSEIQYTSTMEELVLRPVIEDFLKNFTNVGSDARFQFNLAKWQFERRNYLASYTTLIESIVTFACESNGLDWKKFDDRNSMREYLTDTKAAMSPAIKRNYRKINRIRNSLVHQSAYNVRTASEKVNLLRCAINDLDSVIQ